MTSPEEAFEIELATQLSLYPDINIQNLSDTENIPHRGNNRPSVDHILGTRPNLKDGLEPLQKVDALVEVDEEELEQKRKEEAKWKKKYDEIQEITFNKGKKLRPHQVEAIVWMLMRKKNERINGGILQMKQGLGKTLCGLVLAWLDRKKGKTLIICDISIIGEWLNELEEFFNGKHGPKLRVLVLHKDFGTVVKNVTLETIEDYDVVITNYHSCISSAKQGNHKKRVLVRGKIGKHKGDIVGYKHVDSCGDDEDASGISIIHNYSWLNIIADEAQKMCNMTTSTFKSIISIHGEHHLAFTGTPQKNKDSDMWSILFFCGYNDVNNPSHWSHNLWKNDAELRSCLFYKELKENNEEDIKAHQVDLKLPNKHFIEHEITFSEKELIVYRYYFDELWSAYQKYITRPDGTAFMAVLGLLCRLRQMCIAPHLICTEALRESREKIEKGHDFKIQETALAVADDDDVVELEDWIHNELLSGRGSSKMTCYINTILDLYYGTEEKMIVFTNFSSALYMLKDALIGKGLTHEEKSKQAHRLLDEESIIIVDGTVKGSIRRQMLDAFRTNPKIRMLFTNYGVSSCGINLQVASQILLMEPWYTYVAEDQGISRAWRPGQTKPVYVHRFIVKGTIEKQLLNICNGKRSLASSYVNINAKRVRIPNMDKDTLGRLLNNSRLVE